MSLLSSNPIIKYFKDKPISGSLIVGGVLAATGALIIKKIFDINPEYYEIFNHVCMELGFITDTRGFKIATKKDKHIDKDELMRILKKLTVGFYSTCREFSEMAMSVRVNLATKGLTLTTEELTHQLRDQGGVAQKLQSVQSKILAEEGLTEEQLVASQQIYSDDEELLQILQGFENMLDDSLVGNVPVLPWMSEPTIKKEELRVCMYKIHEVEVQHVCNRFAAAGGIMRSVQELGKALAQASSSAEKEVLSALTFTAEDYFSNIGLHCRLDPIFANERDVIEKEHRNRMIKMFKLASMRLEQGGDPNSNEDGDGAATAAAATAAAPVPTSDSLVTAAPTEDAPASGNVTN